MADKPKHGEIRFSQTVQGDAYRVRATMFFDPRLVYGSGCPYFDTGRPCGRKPYCGVCQNQ